jgi:aspartate 1-decarboxylase
MFVSMLKSKLHNATVTGCLRDYEGSIEIDTSLMKAVGILPYEKVLVANLANGNRFETYVIPGKRDSGTISLNGAAALLAKKGDRVIVLSFVLVPVGRTTGHRPRILALDRSNRPVRKNRSSKQA